MLARVLFVLIAVTAAGEVFADEPSPQAAHVTELQQMVRVLSQSRQFAEEALSRALAMIQVQDEQIKKLQAEATKAQPQTENGQH